MQDIELWGRTESGWLPLAVGQSVTPPDPPEPEVFGVGLYGAAVYGGEVD